MYNSKLKTFFKKEMVPNIPFGTNFSKSPLKAALLLEFLKKNHLDILDLNQDWLPFEKDHFLLAHTEEYVESFFNGQKPLCESNSLKWSKEFANSIRYTNASLYYAIKNSLYNSEEISFSPTAGFHHAIPERGMGFCTFSGQVIASILIYRTYKQIGAYIDLDGHHGNSIDNSGKFVPDLNEAIAYNINPVGTHSSYLLDLKEHLFILKEDLLSEKVNYVVAVSGADSHSDDATGGQCNTEEWLECKKMVYTMIKEVSKKLNRHVPLTITLFGGYRDDDFNSILNLHSADLVMALNMLTDQKINFECKVIPRIREEDSDFISYYTRKRNIS